MVKSDARRCEMFSVNPKLQGRHFELERENNPTSGSFRNSRFPNSLNEAVCVVTWGHKRSCFKAIIRINIHFAWFFFISFQKKIMCDLSLFLSVSVTMRSILPQRDIFWKEFLETGHTVFMKRKGESKRVLLLVISIGGKRRR